MKRLLFLLVVGLIVSAPRPAFAQRFGGQFGGAAGFWMVFIDPGIDAGRSFDRDVGGVIGLGGRGFLQTGKLRLGGGAFGGTFLDEGLNADGNMVEGGLSGGGFIAEYLLVQQDYELAFGGMAGGGSLTIEEILDASGGVQSLRRRRDTIFIGNPWVRGAYNLAPFVNVGLQLGYLLGSEDVGGVTLGIDVLVGLIP